MAPVLNLGRYSPMRLTASVLFGLLALSACGENSTEPEQPTSEGVIEFSFSGDRAGRFLARGEPLADGERNPTRDVAGVLIKGSSPQTTQIYATDYSRPPLAETFALTLFGPPGSLKPGTYPLRVPGCSMGEQLCPVMMRMVAGVDFSTGQYEAVYMMGSGTVTITDVSSTRLRGTFSASREALSITQGTFDVAIQQQ